MKFPSTITIRILIVGCIFVANSCEGHSIRNLNNDATDSEIVNAQNKFALASTYVAPHQPVVLPRNARIRHKDENATYGVPPYTVGIVTWAGGGGNFCPSSGVTVSISCSSGSPQLLANDPMPSVSSCKFQRKVLKCTSLPINEFASVGVSCSGGNNITASIPQKTYRSCTRANATEGVFQAVYLNQICTLQNGTIYGEPSDNCGAGSLLLTTFFGDQYCFQASYNCQKGGRGKSKTCSATVGRASITNSLTCIQNETVGFF
jgi:hypothetical protein